MSLPSPRSTILSVMVRAMGFMWLRMAQRCTKILDAAQLANPGLAPWRGGRRLNRSASPQLIRVKPATANLPDYLKMEWQPIITAPFDRDLELAVLDYDGPHALVFPCRRVLRGWIRAETKAPPVNVRPTHWRDWSESVRPLSSSRRPVS